MQLGKTVEELGDISLREFKYWRAFYDYLHTKSKEPKP